MEKCEYGGNRRRLCDNDDCKFCFDRSFASHPKSEYWSDTLNENINPRRVTKFSHKVYWFDCSVCGHSFDMEVSHVSLGQWCQYCSHKRLCKNDDCEFCEKISFRSCEMSKYWSDNNIDTPRSLTKYSHEERLFICPNCPHEFPAILACISVGRWCPFCSSKILCEDDNCNFCFDKSFASRPEAEFWSKRNKKNPRECHKGSGEFIFFDCPKCGHEFYEALHSILSGRWCQYCCIPPKKMCGIDIDCDFCYNMSFASCPEAEYWSEKNNKNSREVFKNSNNKFWFDCPVCYHEFEIRLFDVVDGHWCKYCSGKLCGKKDCLLCWEKSFASQDRSLFWSEKNEDEPWQLSLMSHENRWFDCKECGCDFETTVASVSSGHWCPTCKKRTEKKLLRLLWKNFPDAIIYQYDPDWCTNIKTGRHLKFDFYIPSLDIIIEIDGDQHFKQVSNWTSPDNIHLTDLFKMNRAIENGISVLRLYQPEVYSKTWNYDKFSTTYLRKGIFPTIKCISESNMYDKSFCEYIIKNSIDEIIEKI
jgi:DNA-directed RNA polymerase subunit RPC12/RpoP